MRVNDAWYDGALPAIYHGGARIDERRDVGETRHRDNAASAHRDGIGLSAAIAGRCVHHAVAEHHVDRSQFVHPGPVDLTHRAGKR